MNPEEKARQNIDKLLDLFFMVLDKIRYFSENTFGYNCIQEDIRT